MVKKVHSRVIRSSSLEDREHHNSLDGLLDRLEDVIAHRSDPVSKKRREFSNHDSSLHGSLLDCYA